MAPWIPVFVPCRKQQVSHATLHWGQPTGGATRAHVFCPGAHTVWQPHSFPGLTLVGVDRR